MKNVKACFSLIALTIIGIQTNAQIYTDEVQVEDGFNGNVGIRIQPSTHSFKNLQIDGNTLTTGGMYLNGYLTTYQNTVLGILGNGSGKVYFQTRSNGATRRLLDMVETQSGTYIRMYQADSVANLINSNGKSYFYGDQLGTSDRIGIGTKDPSERLDVIGNIKASGDVIADGNISSNEDITAYGCLTADGSFYSGPGTLMVLPKANASEGGEIVLLGSGANNDWSIDNFQGMMWFQNGPTPAMTIRADGRIGIGAVEFTEKLHVAGTVRAFSYISNSTTYADFVFEDNYHLPSLSEVEAYIKQNKHLPEIPTEAEVMKDGINLTEMNVKLLQKVEELTLYIIEQNKRIEKLEKLEFQKPK